MASIVKRKSKYSVVYDYIDENGKRRQRWETFSTNAEAKKRKKQIEYEQDSGTFFIPTAKTLNDLLDEYMSIYGVNTWAMSTYESRRGLARNYITPIIGDMLLYHRGFSIAFCCRKRGIKSILSSCYLPLCLAFFFSCRMAN